MSRRLVDKFLACTYRWSPRRTANPLAVAADGDPSPEPDFGPLMSVTMVAELKE